MNDEIWGLYLKALTAGGIVSHGCTEENHVGITWKFFQQLGIDASGKKFLDVGCQGNHLKSLVKSEWTGIDLLGEGHDLGDVHELPYAPETFDIVYCNHTLEHVLSPIIVLSEILRVTKKGGDIIIGVPVFPNFFAADHNYILPAKSWQHLFDRLGMVLIKKLEKNGCGVFYLKRDFSYTTADVNSLIEKYTGKKATLLDGKEISINGN